MSAHKLSKTNSCRPRVRGLERLESRNTPAQFVVNSLADTSAGAGGLGTLRHCIDQANITAGPDTITFDPTLFASSQTIKLNGTQLTSFTDKTGATTINGPTQPVGINADGKSRVFMIDSGVIVNLDRLTITGGKVGFPGGAGITNSGTLQITNSTLSNNISGDVGGGIFNFSKLTMINCLFDGNSGFSGGAVYSTFNGSDGAVVVVNSSFVDNGADDGAALTSQAPLTIENSVFTNNGLSGGNGGAIHSSNALNINNSTFTGNSGQDCGALWCTGTVNITNSKFTANLATVTGGSAGAVNYGGGGAMTINGSTFENNKGRSVGGIRSTGTATVINSSITDNVGILGGSGGITNSGSLSILNSTLAGNSGASGGGINSSGILTIRNSTLTGNSATNGGAIALIGSSAKLTVFNSTIAGNTAAIEGGGIHSSSKNQGITLQSTIVADNTNDVSPDFHFNTVSTVSGDNNLVGVVDTSYFSLSGNNNQSGTFTSRLDAKLGPLADNGGPTKTRALLPDSPAINAGNNTLNLPYDQRGFARTIAGQTDIGAFEFASVPRVNAIIINEGTDQRSRVTTIAIAFSTLVSLPPNPATAITLVNQTSLALVDLTTAVTNNGATIVTLTFSGAMSEFQSLVDGRYSLTVFADQVSAAGIALDGDSNGIAGGNFVLAGSTENGLFRLFGDANGDGKVTASDFSSFRLSYGSNSSVFDFDNNGIVTATDFSEFRMRYGMVI